MASTKHMGKLVNSGKKHFQTEDEIVKPDVIVNCNRSIGDVDNLSRVIGPFAIAEKKWYHKFA